MANTEVPEQASTPEKKGSNKRVKADWGDCPLLSPVVKRRKRDEEVCAILTECNWSVLHEGVEEIAFKAGETIVPVGSSPGLSASFPRAMRGIDPAWWLRARHLSIE